MTEELLRWFNVIIMTIWLLQAPALQAQVSPPVASWVSARVLRIDAYEAGCIKAYPGGDNIACDFEGGHWWVLIPSTYNDQGTNPLYPDRYYGLLAPDGVTPRGKIVLPRNPFLAYFPAILVP